jgi:transcriptional regulator with XRE-family HTH domain
MRYLSSFNRRLRLLRDEQCLSESDVAELCQVDEQLVRRWESSDSIQRCFPNLDQLLVLCCRTRTPLERLLDLDELMTGGQLELPGLTTDESDLGKAIDDLQREIMERLPGAEERELLKRFRAANAENRRLILQLLS